MGARRFSPAEIAVHATFGTLVGICIVTGLFLYVDALSVLVGRRATLAEIHLISGLLIPVPLALGILSSAFRRDAAMLERFSDDDRRWLRAKDRRSGRIPVDKFNGGQKLNAAFSVGAVLSLFVTGLVMGSVLHAWPVEWRTGATFVHDWVALALIVTVVGHIRFALRYGQGDEPALVASR